MTVRSESVHFDVHFTGEPGIAGNRMSPFWILLQLRMMELVVTTGGIDGQSSSQIVTNIPTPRFLQTRCHCACECKFI